MASPSVKPVLNDATMTTLHRGGGVALWRKIEEALADEIARLPAGAERRLPPEQVLARRFGVHRHTIRQAVRALCNRGLIQVVHGRGMFAPTLPLDYGIGPQTRFSANLAAQDRVPARRILDFAVRPGTPQELAQLELDPGAQLAAIQSLGLADDLPLCVATSCLPVARFPGVVEQLSRFTTFTSLLAGYGVRDYRRRATRLCATLPNKPDAQLLGQRPGEPILVTEAVDIDDKNVPITFGVTRWAANRVQFSIGT